MAKSYGTLMTFDTLASNNQTVAQIGEDVVWQALSVELEVHNRFQREQVMYFADTTTDRMRRFGNAVSMEMEELAELGKPKPQKVVAGANVGFPLYNYGIENQWTRKWLLNAKGTEVAAQFQGVLDADAKLVSRKLVGTLMNPTNNLTYTDDFVDSVTLPLRQLANADGSALPVSPNGVTFNPATHTHYLATAALAASDVRALITTVAEHFNAGQIKLLINTAQEAGIRAMTTAGDFLPYQDPRITPSVNQSNVLGLRLDMMNAYDRAIGIFGAAEVIVKPWVPANYIIAILVGGIEKALAWRTRPNASGALELEYDYDAFPLRNKGWTHEFGFGVWNRVAAAVLYTGGGAYVAPVLP